MEIPFTTETFFFATTVIGLIFSVYFFFRNPQIKMDKQQALDHEEAENQASNLEQRFQWNKEIYEKRFSDIQTNIKDAFSMAQNHTHTIDVKVSGLIEQVNSMNIAITKLKVILDERLPAKK